MFYALLRFIFVPAASDKIFYPTSNLFGKNPSTFQAGDIFSNKNNNFNVRSNFIVIF